MQLFTKTFLPTVVVAGMVCTAGLFAQETPQANDSRKSDTDKDAKTMTVTGCLARATTANEYIIKSGEGTSYGLEAGGENLNLRAHVGHKVTVSGISLKGKGPHDDDRIRVTNLVMVSTTCP